MKVTSLYLHGNESVGGAEMQICAKSLWILKNHLEITADENKVNIKQNYKKATWVITVLQIANFN